MSVLSFVLQIICRCFCYLSRQSLTLSKWFRVPSFALKATADRQGSGLKVCSSELQANSELKIQCGSERPQPSACPVEFCEADPLLCGDSTGVLSPRLFKLILFLLIPCTLYLIPATSPAAGAAPVSFAWDKNPEPNITGYKMHYGTTSGNYDHSVDVGNYTSCTISGLEEGTTYYFAATAYVSGNSESGFSQELAYTIPVVDSDNDGIPNKDEINIYRTDPNKIDTDGDGINDGAEITLWGSDWNTDFDGDGLINLLDPDSDNDGYPDGSSPPPPASPPALPAPAPPAPAIPALTLEIGEVQIDHNWQYVEFKKSFRDPIVIAKSISLNGSDPAVIRIRHVDEYGFEIRVQEWDYLDATHAEETVSYLVMEPGSYTLDDGAQVEAGRFETDKTKGFEPLNFSQSFQEIPVVITSILSINESDAVTGRIRNIDIQGFDFRLQEQERNSKRHATETIGYIAWEPSVGTIDGLTFEINKTGDSVTHNFYTIQFSQNFMNTPLFIADMQTGDSMNAANVRWQNKDAYAVEVQIDEEQSKDNEIMHGTEVVGYMVFSRQLN